MYFQNKGYLLELVLSRNWSDYIYFKDLSDFKRREKKIRIFTKLTARWWEQKGHSLSTLYSSVMSAVYNKHELISVEKLRGKKTLLYPHINRYKSPKNSVFSSLDI